MTAQVVVRPHAIVDASYREEHVTRLGAGELPGGLVRQPEGCTELVIYCASSLRTLCTHSLSSVTATDWQRRRAIKSNSVSFAALPDGSNQGKDSLVGLLGRLLHIC